MPTNSDHAHVSQSGKLPAEVASPSQVADDHTFFGCGLATGTEELVESTGFRVIDMSPAAVLPTTATSSPQLSRSGILLSRGSNAFVFWGPGWGRPCKGVMAKDVHGGSVLHQAETPRCSSSTSQIRSRLKEEHTIELA